MYSTVLHHQGPYPKSRVEVIPSDVIPSFAYGRKSRPSTPIASVIGSQYSLEYEDFHADANHTLRVMCFTHHLQLGAAAQA